MIQLGMLMKPTDKIHLESRVEMADIVDLTQMPKLPLLNFIDGSIRAKLRVFFVVLSLMGIIWSMLGIGLFWDRYPKPFWFLIGVIWAVIGFGVALIGILNFFTLHRHHTLAIYEDKVAFLKHTFKDVFDEIGFDRAYLATFVRVRYGDRIFLHHVEFSEDGQFYKTHETMIAKFWGIEKHGGQECVNLINALIQAYHKEHGLIHKLPQVRFVSQR